AAGFSFTPNDNGSYVVSLRVTDDDGDHGDAAAKTIAVTNVAPNITAASFANGGTAACPALGALSNATLNVSFADPGSADTWNAEIDWEYDGTFVADETKFNVGTSFSAEHLYTTNGVHVAAVRISDDDGGGSAASSGIQLRVLYNLSAILAPFNPDGTSVWKFGSTIPVKVRITDCMGDPVAGLAPQVGWSLSSSHAPSDAISETASTSAADTTGVMRYDAFAGQYIYNFATKNLPDGNATYYMYVRGKDTTGVLVTNPAQVNQKFGIRTK
ncbi:MAG: PKD domain-containing protein, partial [Actinomycetota bacterium]|nr:PKD domain-containing protein [Actinomycetota bacterium]